MGITSVTTKTTFEIYEPTHFGEDEGSREVIVEHTEEFMQTLERLSQKQIDEKCVHVMGDYETSVERTENIPNVGKIVFLKMMDLGWSEWGSKYRTGVHKILGPFLVVEEKQAESVPEAQNAEAMNEIKEDVKKDPVPICKNCGEKASCCGRDVGGVDCLDHFWFGCKNCGRIEAAEKSGGTPCVGSWINSCPYCGKEATSHSSGDTLGGIEEIAGLWSVGVIREGDPAKKKTITK